MTFQPAIHPQRILRLQEVTRLTGLGRSSIYSLMAANAFPKSISLGARCVGWIEAEIVEWIAARIAASRS